MGLFKTIENLCGANPLSATGAEHRFNIYIPDLLCSNNLSLSSTFAYFTMFQQIGECDSSFSLKIYLTFRCFSSFQCEKQKLQTDDGKYPYVQIYSFLSLTSAGYKKCTVE